MRAAPLLPSGTCVYVPSLPARPLALSLPVLAAIRAQGLDPVPHVAARRVGSRRRAGAVPQAGGARARRAPRDADRRRRTESAGPVARQRAAAGRAACCATAGVREIGIAAYPEGHPQIAQEALRRAFEREARAGARAEPRPLRGHAVLLRARSHRRVCCRARAHACPTCRFTWACRGRATRWRCCATRSAAAWAPRCARCRRWAPASRTW